MNLDSFECLENISELHGNILTVAWNPLSYMVIIADKKLLLICKWLCSQNF